MLFKSKCPYGREGSTPFTAIEKFLRVEVRFMGQMGPMGRMRLMENMSPNQFEISDMNSARVD